MLTVNTDIADRLINGQIGNVKYILTDRGNVVKIYILWMIQILVLRKGTQMP